MWGSHGPACPGGPPAPVSLVLAAPGGSSWPYHPPAMRVQKLRQRRVSRPGSRCHNGVRLPGAPTASPGGAQPSSPLQDRPDLPAAASRAPTGASTGPTACQAGLPRSAAEASVWSNGERLGVIPDTLGIPPCPRAGLSLGHKARRARSCPQEPVAPRGLNQQVCETCWGGQ